VLLLAEELNGGLSKPPHQDKEEIPLEEASEI
jgi:hypothetical protein